MLSWRQWVLLSLLFGRVLAAADRPNIVFILADDLGYGDIGPFGQQLITTPALDRLAAEGVKITQFYAGSAVCAPSRSVFITGQDTGHTRVRGNAGPGNPAAQTLTGEDASIAEMLKRAGYTTGLIGKWGLGASDSSGAPQRKGFDYHFGFLNQTHAHNHFPNFLWRNGERVPLPNDLVPVGQVEGTGYATKPAAYANDLFWADAEKFIEDNRTRPFFLYLAITTPHANNERSRVLGDGNEVPEDEYAGYAQYDWKRSLKGHAAMITRMDRQLGSLLAKLKELGLDEKTLVIFTSDNGAHREGGPDYKPEFFQASGPWRGIKRDLTEGGIRVPFLARWPGKIPAGSVSGAATYLGDMMATFAELAGTRPPENVNSITILPALIGTGKLAAREYLYWEFYEGGVVQAVLIDGHWKVIRKFGQAMQVFDLNTDPGETRNIAALQGAIVKRAAMLFQTARVDNEHWKLGAPPPEAPAR